MMACEMGLVHMSRQEMWAMKSSMLDVDINNEGSFDVDLMMESLTPLFTCLQISIWPPMRRPGS